MRREERNSSMLRIKERERCVTCNHGESERKKGTKSWEEVGLKKEQNETKQNILRPLFLCVGVLYLGREQEEIVWPTLSCSLRQPTNPTPRDSSFVGPRLSTKSYQTSQLPEYYSIIL